VEKRITGYAYRLDALVPYKEAFQAHWEMQCFSLRIKAELEMVEIDGEAMTAYVAEDGRIYACGPASIWNIEPLILPHFDRVKEVFFCRAAGRPARHDSWALIVPASYLGVGVRGRYNVLRLMRGGGQMTVIGRELPLKLARKVAKRPPDHDGTPAE
jgi:hypothetical protein